MQHIALSLSLSYAFNTYRMHIYMHKMHVYAFNTYAYVSILYVLMHIDMHWEMYSNYVCILYVLNDIYICVASAYL